MEDLTSGLDPDVSMDPDEPEGSDLDEDDEEFIDEPLPSPLQMPSSGPGSTATSITSSPPNNEDFLPPFNFTGKPLSTIKRGRGRPRREGGKPLPRKQNVGNKIKRIKPPGYGRGVSGGSRKFRGYERPDFDFGSFSMGSSEDLAMLDPDTGALIFTDREKPQLVADDLPYAPDQWPGKVCAFCNLGERSQLGQGDMLRLNCPSGFTLQKASSSSDTSNTSAFVPERDSGDKSPRGPVTCRRQKSFNKCRNPSVASEYIEELSIIGYAEEPDVSMWFENDQFYVHRSCALWSTGVTKNENSALENVAQVVLQSSSKKCSFCNHFGASITCKMEDCTKIYHFPCATASGAFQDLASTTLYCTLHLGQASSSESSTCYTCKIMGDIANLMYCSTCGEHYHGTCVGLAQLPGVRAGWQCRKCRLCQVCRIQGDETKLMSCEQCDKIYHASCQRPVVTTIPKYGWKCRCCRVCGDCGSRTPGAGASSRWHSHYTVCDSCYQQRNKGFCCPLCHRAYRAHAHREMVQCTGCNKFVHGTCDPEADLTIYQQRKEAHPEYEYVCLICKNIHSQGRQILLKRNSIDDGGDSLSASQESLYDELAEFDFVGSDSGIRSMGLGKGKPYSASKIAKKRLGYGNGMSGRPKGFGNGLPGKASFIKKQRLSEFGRKRGAKSKMRGMFGVPGVGLQRPTSDGRTDEEPGVENRLVLCSAKDKFVLTQDICVMCGALGTDQEGCLIGCVQCGQCYHPYCVNVKVTKVILQKGWRCLDCTVCEGCGQRNDESRLILCDECDISYHIYCMDPPLDYVPHGNWKCKWCAVCQSCGATDPGFNCTWMNSLSECGPCASHINCASCLEPYSEGDLIIQCVQCERWLHGACDMIKTEEDAEKCAEDGYNCLLCRPRDVPPPHLVPVAVAQKPPTPTKSPDVKPMNYYLDGIYLSENGHNLIKTLTSEHHQTRKKRRKLPTVQDKEAGIMATIESVVSGGKTEGLSLEDLPKLELMDESELYKEGMLWPKEDGPPPDGFTLFTMENGTTVLRRKRQRNLQKMGIGGFLVRVRGVRSGQDNDDIDTLPCQTNALEPPPPMLGEGDKPRRKPIRRKLKSKLSETFPAYLQEAFFGRDLLDASKDLASSSSDEENMTDLEKSINLSHEELNTAAAINIKKEKLSQSDMPLPGSSSSGLVKSGPLSGGLIPKEEEEDPEEFKDVLTLPGDLLDNDLVNTIMNVDDDELTKNTESLDALGDSNMTDDNDLSQTLNSAINHKDTKDELSDILGSHFNLDAIPNINSKDVDDLFKGVLTDESQESQETSAFPLQQTPNVFSGTTSQSTLSQLPLNNAPVRPTTLPNVQTNLNSPMSFPPQSPYHSEYSNSPQFSPAFSESSSNWVSSVSDQSEMEPSTTVNVASTYNQRSSEKMKADEGLGSGATISAVLYANTNHPEWQKEYPNWSDRYKQMIKKWRTLSTDQKAPYLQQARDNRSALRMKKQQQSQITKESTNNLPTSSKIAAPPVLSQIPSQIPVIASVSEDHEKATMQQKSAREAEQERQWKQLQAIRQQQQQQQQHVIHEQRVQGLQISTTPQELSPVASPSPNSRPFPQMGIKSPSYALPSPGVLRQQTPTQDFTDTSPSDPFPQQTQIPKPQGVFQQRMPSVDPYAQQPGTPRPQSGISQLQRPSLHMFSQQPSSGGADNHLRDLLQRQQFKKLDDQFAGKGQLRVWPPADTQEADSSTSSLGGATSSADGPFRQPLPPPPGGARPRMPSPVAQVPRQPAQIMGIRMQPADPRMQGLDARMRLLIQQQQNKQRLAQPNAPLQQGQQSFAPGIVRLTRPANLEQYQQLLQQQQQNNFQQQQRQVILSPQQSPQAQSSPRLPIGQALLGASTLPMVQEQQQVQPSVTQQPQVVGAAQQQLQQPQQTSQQSEQEIPDNVTAELEKLEQETGTMVELQGVSDILGGLGDDDDELLAEMGADFNILEYADPELEALAGEKINISDLELEEPEPVKNDKKTSQPAATQQQKQTLPPQQQQQQTQQGNDQQIPSLQQQQQQVAPAPQQQQQQQQQLVQQQIVQQRQQQAQQLSMQQQQATPQQQPLHPSQIKTELGGVSNIAQAPAVSSTQGASLQQTQQTLSQPPPLAVSQPQGVVHSQQVLQQIHQQMIQQVQQAAAQNRPMPPGSKLQTPDGIVGIVTPNNSVHLQVPTNNYQRILMNHLQNQKQIQLRLGQNQNQNLPRMAAINTNQGLQQLPQGLGGVGMNAPPRMAAAPPPPPPPYPNPPPPYPGSLGGSQSQMGLRMGLLQHPRNHFHHFPMMGFSGHPQRRPMLLEDQPLILQDLVEQEKREQEKKNLKQDNVPSLINQESSSLLSDQDFERLKADVFSGSSLGGLNPATSQVNAPVQNQWQRSPMQTAATVAPPPPPPVDVAPRVQIFNANLLPAPPLPPENVITDHDKQVQHSYEQWLNHQNNVLTQQLRYYETEVQKLRKIRKSLNSKQRQLKKTGNTLGDVDASELQRISSEQAVLQKHLESSRKQSRQHGMLVQEYRNKQAKQHPGQISSPLMMSQQSPLGPPGSSPIHPVQSPSPSPLMSQQQSPMHSPAPLVSPSPGPGSVPLLQSPSTSMSPMQPSPRIGTPHSQGDSPVHSPSQVCLPPPAPRMTSPQHRRVVTSPVAYSGDIRPGTPQMRFVRTPMSMDHSQVMQQRARMPSPQYQQLLQKPGSPVDSPPPQQMTITQQLLQKQLQQQQGLVQQHDNQGDSNLNSVRAAQLIKQRNLIRQAQQQQLQQQLNQQQMGGQPQMQQQQLGQQMNTIQHQQINQQQLGQNQQFNQQQLVQQQLNQQQLGQQQINQQHIVQQQQLNQQQIGQQQQQLNQQQISQQQLNQQQIGQQQLNQQQIGQQQQVGQHQFTQQMGQNINQQQILQHQQQITQPQSLTPQQHQLMVQQQQQLAKQQQMQFAQMQAQARLNQQQNPQNTPPPRSPMSMPPKSPLVQQIMSPRSMPPSPMPPRSPMVNFGTVQQPPQSPIARSPMMHHGMNQPPSSPMMHHQQPPSPMPRSPMIQSPMGGVRRPSSANSSPAMPDRPTSVENPGTPRYMDNMQTGGGNPNNPSNPIPAPSCFGRYGYIKLGLRGGSPMWNFGRGAKRVPTPSEISEASEQTPVMLPKVKKESHLSKVSILKKKPAKGIVPKVVPVPTNSLVSADYDYDEIDSLEISAPSTSRIPSTGGKKGPDAKETQAMLIDDSEKTLCDDIMDFEDDNNTVLSTEVSLNSAAQNDGDDISVIESFEQRDITADVMSSPLDPITDDYLLFHGNIVDIPDDEGEEEYDEENMHIVIRSPTTSDDEYMMQDKTKKYNLDDITEDQLLNMSEQEENSDQQLETDEISFEDEVVLLDSQSKIADEQISTKEDFEELIDENKSEKILKPTIVTDISEFHKYTSSVYTVPQKSSIKVLQKPTATSTTTTTVAITSNKTHPVAHKLSLITSPLIKAGKVDATKLTANVLNLPKLVTSVAPVITIVSASPSQMGQILPSAFTVPVISASAVRQLANVKVIDKPSGSLSLSTHSATNTVLSKKIFEDDSVSPDSSSGENKESDEKTKKPIEIKTPIFIRTIEQKVDDKPSITTTTSIIIQQNRKDMPPTITIAKTEATPKNTTPSVKTELNDALKMENIKISNVIASSSQTQRVPSPIISKRSSPVIIHNTPELKMTAQVIQESQILARSSDGFDNSSDDTKSVVISIPSPTPSQEQLLDNMTLQAIEHRRRDGKGIPTEFESFEDVLDMIENITCDPPANRDSMEVDTPTTKNTTVEKSKENVTSVASILNNTTVATSTGNKPSNIPELSPLSQPTDLTTNMANASQQLRSLLSLHTTSASSTTSSNIDNTIKSVVAAAAAAAAQKQLESTSALTSSLSGTMVTSRIIQQVPVVTTNVSSVIVKPKIGQPAVSTMQTQVKAITSQTVTYLNRSTTPNTTGTLTFIQNRTTGGIQLMPDHPKLPPVTTNVTLRTFGTPLTVVDSTPKKSLSLTAMLQSHPAAVVPTPKPSIDTITAASLLGKPLGISKSNFSTSLVQAQPNVVVSPIPTQASPIKTLVSNVTTTMMMTQPVVRATTTNLLHTQLTKVLKPKTPADEVKEEVKTSETDPTSTIDESINNTIKQQEVSKIVSQLQHAGASSQMISRVEDSNVLLKKLLQNTGCASTQSLLSAASVPVPPPAPPVAVMSSLESQLTKPIPTLSSLLPAIAKSEPNNVVKPPLRTPLMTRETSFVSNPVAQQTQPPPLPVTTHQQLLHIDVKKCMPPSRTPSRDELLSPSTPRSSCSQESSLQTPPLNIKKEPTMPQQLQQMPSLTMTSQQYPMLAQIQQQQHQQHQHAEVKKEIIDESSQHSLHSEVSDQSRSDVQMKEEIDAMDTSMNSDKLIQDKEELKKQKRRMYHQKRRQNQLMSKELALGQPKKRPRKSSKLDEDYDTYIDGVLAQLRALPSMNVSEPILSRNFGVVSVFGSGDLSKVGTTEYDSRFGDLIGAYGNATVPGFVDFYSSKPYGDLEPLPEKPPISTQRGFYDKEFPLIKFDNNEDKRFDLFCREDSPESIVSSSSPECSMDEPPCKFMGLRLISEDEDDEVEDVAKMRLSPVVPLVAPIPIRLKPPGTLIGPHIKDEADSNKENITSLEPCHKSKFGSNNSTPLKDSGNVTVTLTLTSSAAEDIIGVLRDLANILHIPAPTSYQIVERTSTPPSQKLGLYRTKGKDGKEGAPIDIQSILNGAAKFCKHCDVVILNNMIRKRISELPFLYKDAEILCDGDDLYFCSTTCYMQFALMHRSPSITENKAAAIIDYINMDKREGSVGGVKIDMVTQHRGLGEPMEIVSHIKQELNERMSIFNTPYEATKGTTPSEIEKPKPLKGVRYKAWAPGCLHPQTRYKRPTDKETMELLYKLGITVAPPKQADDVRKCMFCQCIGDSVADGPGRLLNYDVDKWVHLNCGLWSEGVYETVNGALMNLENALRQSLVTTCIHCNRLGATVRCFKTRCSSVYHLSCAVKDNCVFLKNKTTFCTAHVPKNEKDSELTTLSVSRRVYINRDENRQVAAVMHHSDTNNLLRVGSLIFLSVGQLLPHQLASFHNSNYIYPIGYKIIRFYWSMRQLNKRCRYICSIHEALGKPEFKVTVQEPPEEEVEFKDASPKGVWGQILDKVATLRSENQCVQIFPKYVSGEDLFGLTEPAVVRVLESLPGIETLSDYKFKYGRNPLLELPLAINPTGSARSEPRLKNQQHWKRHHTQRTTGSSSRPLFGPSPTTPTTTSTFGEVACPYSKQFVHSKSSQYKKMKQEWRNNVYLARSKIQGLGLYAARDIEKHTMVIEYIGEIIRSEVAETREKQYEARNRGIYMFRMDEERVCDATLSGGLARYINHSCNPNCVAEIVEVDRDLRIIIFAKRRIQRGEEFAYDYKFDIEDDQHKISCMCGAPNCKKWMN